ncbi:MAG: sigma-70 family RNA polymerase sigma factor [Lachnospiraceae bacterium]|nr:sigma-70 family RNA polymerase sigma factor [Lachnospiraceae bacterium]
MEQTEYIEAVELYGNTIYRIAYQYCKNKNDAEDIVQNTFIKLFQTTKGFEDKEYLRRWLIRVAINEAKNLRVSFWKKRIFPMQEVKETEVYTFSNEESLTLYDTVMQLPKKYRIVVHLYYYEEYSIKEIADILQMKETTIQTQLMRARKKLKEMLKEAWEDEE